MNASRKIRTGFVSKMPCGLLLGMRDSLVLTPLLCLISITGCFGIHAGTAL